MKSYETNRALKKLSMILFFLITTLCYAINSSPFLEKNEYRYINLFAIESEDNGTKRCLRN